MNIYTAPRMVSFRADPATVSPKRNEPVTLDELKSHLRIFHFDEDLEISAYLRAARETAEAWANRALITQTATVKMSRFPVSTTQLIELPFGTLQSVTSITYVDADGASQTWASSNYIVDTGHIPGRVGLAFNASWPSTRDWDLPITILYEVGFGTTTASVPQALRTAVKMLAAEMYERRDGSVIGAWVNETLLPARTLINVYRVHPI